MCIQSECLDALTISPLKWYNSIAINISEQSTNANDQGELSHCLVKWLYGRTNKRNVTKQIGRHIRQLEHAQDGKKLNISNMNEVMMEQDSDTHHQISKSRNNPLNIYSYVYANQGDPAFVVCHVFK